MKSLLSALSLMLFLFVLQGNCIDFSVEKVIPVGPCDRGMYYPAQWSPDGLWLAYFSGRELLLTDSLGASRSVCEVPMAPHRFRWASNSEILLFQRSYPSADSVHDEIVAIDTESGVIEVLESASRKLWDRSSEEVALDGPYYTIENEAYFRRVDVQGTSRKLSPQRVREKISLRSQHILKTGEDALYLVALDGSDSLRISNRPYESYMDLPMSISPDTQYIMFGGTIVKLEDDTEIILDTINQVKVKPAGTTGCSFGSHSFNPVFPEVAFRLSCDDGHSVVVRRVGVFDYSTFEFTILDTLIDLDNCDRVVFHPQGRRLAVVSNGVLHIIERELAQ